MGLDERRWLFTIEELIRRITRSLGRGGVNSILHLWQHVGPVRSFSCSQDLCKKFLTGSDHTFSSSITPRRSPFNKLLLDTVLNTEET